MPDNRAQDDYDRGYRGGFETFCRTAALRELDHGADESELYYGFDGPYSEGVEDGYKAAEEEFKTNHPRPDEPAPDNSLKREEVLCGCFLIVGLIAGGWYGWGYGGLGGLLLGAALGGTVLCGLGYAAGDALLCLIVVAFFAYLVRILWGVGKN